MALARHIATVVTSECDIPTPALVVDRSRVQRNVQRAAEYAATHGLKLRPHAKTHKSPTQAKAQLAHGAIGLTVAKVGEAFAMAEVCDDLLVGYPIVDAFRAQQIGELATRCTIRVAVDSEAAIGALAQAASRNGATVGILIDVDVGFHRTGIATPQQAIHLAACAEQSANLRLDGIFCFPGQIVARPGEQRDALAHVDRVLHEVISALHNGGFEVDIVSGGSTPTLSTAHHVTALTEIRPGTYIFNDWNCASGGWCEIEDCAASVLCTVVSTTVEGKCVIDAGSKSLARDPHFQQPASAGFGYVVEHPEASIFRLSEEHGEVDIRMLKQPPRLGDRVHVIPNHICPGVNLHDNYWLRRDPHHYETHPVVARGCVV